MRRPVTSLFAVLLGAGLLAAQTQPPPQFTTRADLVRLDVSVLDRSRQAVGNLTVADFTVLEDGKVQAIEHFDRIDLPLPPPAAAGWMRDVGADVASNTILTDRRLVVLLLDDTMVPFDPYMVRTARETALGVVDRLGPADLAAVVFSRDNRHAQNFTSDKSRLAAAIEGFQSAGYVPVPKIHQTAEVERHWAESVQTLYRVVDTLAQIPDRRKMVVHITIGIPLLIDTPETALSAHPYLNWLSRQTMGRAQRGNVNIYSVDPGGLDGVRSYMLLRNTRTEVWVREQIEDEPRRYHDFLRAMAAQTGGHAFVDTNEFSSRLDQMFRETGSFYLLGYRSTNARADGRFRRLQVRVNRPGVTVRTRSGYYAPSDRAPRMTVPEADAALAGLVPKTDLALTMAAAPFALPGRSDAAIAMTLGVRRAEGQRGPEPMDVVMQAFTPDGGSRGSLRLSATATAAPEAHASGDYEVIGRLDLPPGRYELRASAASPSAGSGSVYGYVDVPDFARAPVSLSGIALLVDPPAPSGGATATGGLLPFVPTTRRMFTSGDRVRVFARGYQGGAPAPLPARAVLRIVDRADATVFEADTPLEPDAFTSDRGADLTFELPIQRLAAGEYLLTLELTLPRADVRPGGAPAVRRQVRFDVR
jgi:VWFA-related protein